jgi:3-methyladenine DNA glycosylase AlkD
MTEKEVLKALKTMGTAQNRKVYKRHGVDSDMYGVSYANFKKLKAKIKTDHDLAKSLWQTGNHDARVLATMIADPNKMDKRLINTWVKDLACYPLTDAFVATVSRAPGARSHMEAWTKAKDEWTGSAGWSLLAYLAMNDRQMKDKEFDDYLRKIESGIHKSKNRVRHSMNSALIAMGARSAGLEKKALAVAKKIGRVEVDHGETGCKTPDAVSYIPKARERQTARQARA